MSGRNRLQLLPSPTTSPSASRPARSSPPSTSSPRRASRETQEEPQGEDDAAEEETVGPPEDDRDELLEDAPRGEAEGRISPSWRRRGESGRRPRDKDSRTPTRALRRSRTLPCGSAMTSGCQKCYRARRWGGSCCGELASVATQALPSSQRRGTPCGWRTSRSLRAMEEEILAQELRAWLW